MLINWIRRRKLISALLVLNVFGLAFFFVNHLSRNRIMLQRRQRNIETVAAGLDATGAMSHDQYIKMTDIFFAAERNHGTMSDADLDFLIPIINRKSATLGEFRRYGIVEANIQVDMATLKSVTPEQKQALFRQFVNAAANPTELRGASTPFIVYSRICARVHDTRALPYLLAMTNYPNKGVRRVVATSLHDFGYNAPAPGQTLVGKSP